MYLWKILFLFLVGGVSELAAVWLDDRGKGEGLLCTLWTICDAATDTKSVVPPSAILHPPVALIPNDAHQQCDVTFGGKQKGSYVAVCLLLGPVGLFNPGPHSTAPLDMVSIAEDQSLPVDFNGT